MGVTRKLGDFNESKWPMHTEAARADLYKQVMEKNGQGRETYGIVSPPILSLPLLSIIPCNLHCIMAIMKKLVHHPDSMIMTITS